jgi:hypothetical protein
MFTGPLMHYRNSAYVQFSCQSTEFFKVLISLKQVSKLDSITLITSADRTHYIFAEMKCHYDHATPQVDSHWFPIVAAWVWTPIMWNLWWTKWNWGRFSPSTSVSPANPHSTKCSTFINHPTISVYNLNTDGVIK